MIPGAVAVRINTHIKQAHRNKYIISYEKVYCDKCTLSHSNMYNVYNNAHYHTVICIIMYTIIHTRRTAQKYK